MAKQSHYPRPKLDREMDQGKPTKLPATSGEDDQLDFQNSAQVQGLTQKATDPRRDCSQSDVKPYFCSLSSCGEGGLALKMPLALILPSIFSNMWIITTSPAWFSDKARLF